MVAIFAMVFLVGEFVVHEPHHMNHVGPLPPLHLSVGRFPCGAITLEKGRAILLCGVKKCGGNYETWRSDRRLSWKTAPETALCLGCSRKRGSPVGTAASLLKHGQSFAELPISQADDTEICDLL